MGMSWNVSRGAGDLLRQIAATKANRKDQEELELAKFPKGNLKNIAEKRDKETQKFLKKV